MIGLEVHSQPTDSSKVWFTPNIASVDMLDLFNNPEQWDSARSKIYVFKFYTGQVGSEGWSCTVNPSSNCGENHLENFVNVQADNLQDSIIRFNGLELASMFSHSLSSTGQALTAVWNQN